MMNISKENVIYKMCPTNPPSATAAPGSTLNFSTYDCFQNQISSNLQEVSGLDWDQINPATGPVYIEGAKAGDILKVTIKDIQTSHVGVMAAIPGAGLLGDLVTEPQVKVVPIGDGHVSFNPRIKIPVSPMIGVIGVAPGAEAIPCGTPGSHGGNMDNKKITAGTTLYFPVFVDGALLAMGDLHAAMGDGEIMVTGVETSGTVTVVVDVIKGQSISHPILETDTHFYTIASHEDLLGAVKIATQEMQKIVMSQLDLSFNEAGMFLSAAGDAEIAQVVDPLLTARFGVSKKYLPSLW